MSSIPKIEPVYVLDTHALIWYLRSDRKLGAQAAAIFEAAKRGETLLVVSAIVIAELFYADKKWGLFADFNKVYADLKAQPYIQLIEFLPDHVLEFTADHTVPEMHDRIIVGVARRLGFPLVTADPQITAAGIVSTVW